MGSKQGHCKFYQLRRALHFGVQVFEGYPHRRHRKNGHREKITRSQMVEKIKQAEYDEEFKKSKFNINNENL